LYLQVKVNISDLSNPSDDFIPQERNINKWVVCPRITTLADIELIGNGQHPEKQLQFIAGICDTLKFPEHFIKYVPEHAPRPRENTVLVDPRANRLAFHRSYQLLPLTEEIKVKLTQAAEKNKPIFLLKQGLCCRKSHTCKTPSVEEMRDKSRQAQCLFNYRYSVNAYPQDLLNAGSTGKKVSHIYQN
jgi:hypothetical protein